MLLSASLRSCLIVMIAYLIHNIFELACELSLNSFHFEQLLWTTTTHEELNSKSRKLVPLCGLEASCKFEKHQAELGSELRDNNKFWMANGKNRCARGLSLC
mmetsp:Transcript_7948/g.10644  ORF Transcript_7948/g.10644 Transcript_7948/m.10644 type:complete len:102 (-) Transcript_7948:5266-5571(-)